MSEPERAPVTIAEADRALNEALVRAQAEFPAIAKSTVVDTGSFKYSYAPLDAILAAVRPVLAKNGLAIVQRLEAPAGVRMLRTELRHREGGVLAASFPLGDQPGPPQALGSLLTYLRRYAISALLCIAAEEDDDAQGATVGDAVPRGAERADEGDQSAFRPPAELRPDPGGGEALSDPQRKKIYALRTKLVNAGAFTEETWGEIMSADYGTESVRELTKAQASHLIERLVRRENEEGL